MESEQQRFKPQRARRTRSDKGTVRLTERDIHVLSWIADQYVVRFDQLRVLLVAAQVGGKTRSTGELSVSATRNAVTRWQQLELVRMQKHLMSEPPYVWITGHGLHVLQKEYRYIEPSPMSYGHLHAVNRVRAFIESKRPGDVWTSERQLRLEQPKTAAGHARPHLPDGVLNATTAIEVELSFKKKDRLIAIMRGLAAQYKTIWYFCSEATGKAVVQALNELPESDRKRFLIYDLEGNRLEILPAN